MKQNYPISLFAAIALILSIMTVTTSCSSSKKLRYFTDLPDSTIVELPPTFPPERIIEAGDRLSIIIGGRDQEAAAYFNKRPVSSNGASGSTSSMGAEGGSGGGAAGEPLTGYLVTNDGFIEFPILGQVRVKGMTQKELKNELTRLVTPYLKEPLVDVAFTTFRVTFIGEVRSPGTHVIPMQRTTIFDALASAGDLPHSAKRYDISLYRDYNGKRTITKIDLRKKDFLYNDQIFQMRHNDVLYIQPRNSSVFTEDFGVFTAVFTLIVSTVTLIFTVFQNN